MTLAAAISTVLFVLIFGAIAWAGYRHYVRPSQVFQQLGGSSTAFRGEMVGTGRREGAVVKIFREVGKAMPVSPADASEARRELMAAGYRSDSALTTYYGWKALTALALGGAALTLMQLFSVTLVQTLFLTGFALVAGFFLPTLILEYLVKRRQMELRFSLPDVLDLMVVCVDAGLGLDQAILTISKEFRAAHKDMAEELELVNLEIQAGSRRADALRNLARRTRVPEIQKLVAILIQTDRFGTSVADSLRTHSDFMRVRRRQEAEERANKVGVKLVFPIFFLILPAMLVVIAGPGLLQVVKELFPMMRQYRLDNI